VNCLVPPAFEPVLRKLSADSQRYFGEARVTIEPLEHMERPFSAILQIGVSRRPDAPRAFVKILKPAADTPENIASMREEVRNDFEVTGRVYAGLTDRDGLSAVRPIACFPEDLAIVTEQLGGSTLAAVLRTRAAGRPRARTIEELHRVVDRVGSWLRAFQAIAPIDQRVSLEIWRSYLDVRLAKLDGNGPTRLTSDEQRLLQRYFDGQAREVSDAQLGAVWIHADLCPENVVVLSDRVAVLDFTTVKSGPIYHDIAHLYMQIDLLRAKPWFNRRIVRSLQQRLLDAFEPGLAPSRPLFALLLLLHVVCHLVALQNPPRGLLTRPYAGYVARRHVRWLREVAARGLES